MYCWHATARHANNETLTGHFFNPELRDIEEFPNIKQFALHFLHF